MDGKLKVRKLWRDAKKSKAPVIPHGEDFVRVAVLMEEKDPVKRKNRNEKLYVGTFRIYRPDAFSGVLPWEQNVRKTAS